MSQSQFPPPTAEDVRELAAKLRSVAPQNPLGIADPTILRVADLLERRHPTPVPVSERPWEREGWCDEAGKCWLGTPQNGVFDAIWILHKPPKRPIWRIAFSLPAHALPLPAGEVEE